MTTGTDLAVGAGKVKHGCKKVRFCEQQSRQDDLWYFSIDTCCILDRIGSDGLAIHLSVQVLACVIGLVVELLWPREAVIGGRV